MNKYLELKKAIEEFLELRKNLNNRNYESAYTTSFKYKF